ncbi:MAG: LOG family protein [Cyanobacteria bacterium WB6_1B_304]|jgi:uncharacterized protein (TIGR00730 family)|nr:LOG family protein [Cyanobacteria bacterium WB6_1B_304]
MDLPTALSPSHSQSTELDQLRSDLLHLLDRLPSLHHQPWIQRTLATLIRLADEEIDRLDWKIVAASMQDMEQGFKTFFPYRHIRKVAIFGSARTTPKELEYQTAVTFARDIVQQGFMVMTGAGGGIMQAGNEGATPQHSFGLNIWLPFEQGANPFIHDDPKLLRFKYFFTRKLFFLRESDAIALFPGGFGTQDEAFECLTLSQTGKFGPAPMVLVDRPGGSYWYEWQDYVRDHLLKTGLISSDDLSLYTITDQVHVACSTIINFYRVYHSSRYVGDRLVIRLKIELSDETVETLNDQYSDLLLSGKIIKTPPLPEEVGHETWALPRLLLHFNQRNLGRLHQFIGEINQISSASPVIEHPEEK